MTCLSGFVKGNPKGAGEALQRRVGLGASALLLDRVVLAGVAGGLLGVLGLAREVGAVAGLLRSVDRVLVLGHVLGFAGLAAGLAAGALLLLALLLDRLEAGGRGRGLALRGAGRGDAGGLGGGGAALELGDVGAEFAAGAAAWGVAGVGDPGGRCSAGGLVAGSARDELAV